MVSVTIPVSDPSGDANDTMAYFATQVQAALDNLNNAAVFTTGAQSVAGVKTLTDNPVVSNVAPSVVLTETDDSNKSAEVVRSNGTLFLLNDDGRIRFAADTATTDITDFTVRFDGAHQDIHHTGEPAVLPSYTVGTLPSASTYADGLIKVSDETGGDTVAFSDGTNWRRVQDRAVVS